VAFKDDLDHTPRFVVEDGRREAKQRVSGVNKVVINSAVYIIILYKV